MPLQKTLNESGAVFTLNALNIQCVMQLLLMTRVATRDYRLVGSLSPWLLLHVLHNNILTIFG